MMYLYLVLSLSEQMVLMRSGEAMVTIYYKPIEIIHLTQEETTSTAVLATTRSMPDLALIVWMEERATIFITWMMSVIA
jgi:hypothetical protein